MAQLSSRFTVKLPVWLRFLLRVHIWLLSTASMFVVIDEEKQAELLMNFILRHIKLTSCHDDPATLGQAIRSHWAIENALHWVLDVTFRKDDSRVRDQHAARNLAVLRKIAVLVSRDRSAKGQCACQAEESCLG